MDWPNVCRAWRAKRPDTWLLRLSRLALGLGATATTVGVAGLVRMSDASPTPPPTPFELARMRVDGLGFGDAVAVRKDDEGVIRVEGHVRGREDARALRALVHALPQPVSQKVWTGEELVGDAGAVLQELGLTGLALEHGGRGRLSASGYVEDPHRWRRARDTIVSDHPGIAAIDDGAIESAPDRFAALELALAEHPWRERVQVSVSAGEAVLSGSLETQQAQALDTVLRKLERRFDGQPRMRSEVTIVALEAAPPPPRTTFAGVVLSSGRRVAIASDGMRYTTGDRLPDQSVISAIELGRVIVTRNGQSFAHRI